jgi:hypothetical protein
MPPFPASCSSIPRGKPPDYRGFDVPLLKNPVSDRAPGAVADGLYFFIKGAPVTLVIDKKRILRQKSTGTAAHPRNPS